MKKIVSDILIVGIQLMVGGLFFWILFSGSDENNTIVVIENESLNKMADSVSALFAESQDSESVIEDDEEEVELLSSEEVEQLRQEEEEAKRKQEEEEAAAKEEEERQSVVVTVDNSVDSLKAYAYDLVVHTYGWSESDYAALVSLWNCESGWNVTASNQSGAYGIPQAKPASKMASEGSDYLTNGETQIRWGLGYISSTYGSPSAAWAFFQEKRYY